MSRPPFSRILVANRGEIAVRIIRAIHDLGASAVAIYSDADADALHVRLADEAHRIGPGPATSSYLNIPAILEAGRATSSEAIHPGYGFLSENAQFAAEVRRAGLVFVGPPADVISLMGDKVAAKRLMKERGIPTLPGYDGEDQSIERLEAEAEAIGYPLMVKAAAGGGGRGMRVVETRDDLRDALEGAAREAAAAFGDGRVFLERLLRDARHIEVQVLADAQGHVIHLFERDCSIQRRHQKVIEEAPAPVLTGEERRHICGTGVGVAEACGYQNAGTVEFLWAGGQCFFLEMNTRIQVEHGVTELVTGRDLVRAQLLIAAGEPLPWSQDDIRLHGHALEARLYAEDPDHEFLPRFGRLTHFDVSPRTVRTDAVARVDTGIEGPAEVSRHYDSLLAKLMTHAPTRDEAIASLLELVDDAWIEGVPTNREFLLWLLSGAAFRTALAGIDFVETSWRPDPSVRTRNLQLIAAVAALVDLAGHSGPQGAGRGRSIWYRHPGWRPGADEVGLGYRIQDQLLLVRCRARSPGWSMTVDGQLHLDYVATLPREDGDDDARLRIRLDDDQRSCRPEVRTDVLLLRDVEGIGWFRNVEIRRAAPIDEAAGSAGRMIVGAQDGADRISSPMPGSVAKISVAVGDEVAARQPLAVLEAMKMEHVIEAPHPGVVRAIHVVPGDPVTGGQLLVEVAAHHGDSGADS